MNARKDERGQSTEEIRILILEDSELDVRLIEEELRNAGIRCSSRHAADEASFKTTLDTYNPDIILSDFCLPSYDGFLALDEVRGLPYCRKEKSMNPDSAKVIIVTSNSGINDTLSAALSDFCPGSNIHSYTDEYEALWQATGVKPDIVITWYGPKSGRSYELLKRLRLYLKTFLGIVVYDPESEEYETALLKVLSRDPEYAGILPVRIDLFGEKMGEIFNGGS